MNTETNVNNVVGVGQHESTAGTATTWGRAGEAVTKCKLNSLVQEGDKT